MFLVLKKRDNLIIEQDEKIIIEKGFNVKEKAIARYYPYDYYPDTHNLEPLIEAIDIEKGRD